MPALAKPSASAQDQMCAGRASSDTGGMDEFTSRLYAVAQVREIEQRAVAAGIASYTLMQRAARRCWHELQRRWPQARTVAIVCGSGNNGGDGYELASLAQAAGRIVCLLQIGSAPSAGDGLRAVHNWQAAGCKRAGADFDLSQADVIVDALFGTGLSRPVNGAALEIIQRINVAGRPVLAVDVPSGLHADTGQVLGVAVQATATVSFVAPKLGLRTGSAVDCVGELVEDALDIPADILDAAVPAAARLTAQNLRQQLPRRRRSAHKGDHGHVLIVGGDHGMMGAALLAGRAALRGGAGWVSIATRDAHTAAMTAAQPELMVHAVEQAEALRPLIAKADVVAIGPGLGQDVWGRALLACALEVPQPLVLDADALNLLAQEPQKNSRWVLTPHPGEAARLLGCSTAEIQADRPAAVRKLQQHYGGVVVLKGAGTLIHGEDMALCDAGNPGMGVGGMGDVLTGVIAALIGQGLSIEPSARLGVFAHARAGDHCAVDGERGLLPSDLIGALRAQLNP